MRRLNLAAITVLDNRDEVLPLDPSIGEVAVLNVGEAQEIQPFLKELSQYTRPVEFRLGKNLPEADGNRLRNGAGQVQTYSGLCHRTPFDALSEFLCKVRS